MQLILSLKYFIPLFNKISLLCGYQSGGDEASIKPKDCNSGPAGHDITDNFGVLEMFQE